MELQAKRNFIDKETGKEYKKGEKIKVDKARGEALLKSPYNIVEEVKKESEKNVQDKSDKESQN